MPWWAGNWRKRHPTCNSYPPLWNIDWCHHNFFKSFSLLIMNIGRRVAHSRTFLGRTSKPGHLPTSQPETGKISSAHIEEAYERVVTANWIPQQWSFCTLKQILNSSTLISIYFRGTANVRILKTGSRSNIWIMSSWPAVSCADQFRSLNRKRGRNVC